jgi:hypothetical protein
MFWQRLYGLAMLMVAFATVWMVWEYRSNQWSVPKPS